MRKVPTNTRRGIIVALLSSALMMPLSACSIFGGDSQDEDLVYVTSQSVEMVQGAKTQLCNNALTMTVTGIQKRPVSTFAGASVINDVADSTGINEMSSTSIIIEVDMALTFNENTFQQVTAAAGGSSKAPSQVSDILVPGSLVFVTGKDPNGGDYVSRAIVMPESQAMPSQAIMNSQWHYSILKEILPEASETLTGSMLFKVSAKARDLKLIIYTANNNPEPLNEESVRLGNNKMLVLDLEQ